MRRRSRVPQREASCSDLNGRRPRTVAVNNALSGAIVIWIEKRSSPEALYICWWDFCYKQARNGPQLCVSGSIGEASEASVPRVRMKCRLAPVAETRGQDEHDSR